MEAIAISSVTPEQWSTFTSESRLRGPWSTQRRWADPGIVDILLDNRQFRWEWSGLRDTAFPSFWHPVTHIPFKFFLKKDHLISPMMNNASTSQHRKPYETSDDFFFYLFAFPVKETTLDSAGVWEIWRSLDEWSIPPPPRAEKDLGYARNHTSLRGRYRNERLTRRSQGFQLRSPGKGVFLGYEESRFPPPCVGKARQPCLHMNKLEIETRTSL